MAAVLRVTKCSTPQGLEDVSKYPYLFAELMQDPTWAEEDLRKLAGLNFLRVFRQVEKVFMFSEVINQKASRRLLLGAVFAIVKRWVYYVCTVYMHMYACTDAA